MCTGFEIAALAAAAVGTYSTVKTSEAQQQAAEAQGAEVNLAAGAEQDAATAQAEKIRQAARRQRAQAKAAYSASGVASDAGTPVKIDQEITYGGESDALMTILSGSRYASSAERQSLIYGKQAEAARNAGYASVASSVLSAGSSYASASGWRSQGPGFSGTQKPAPITTAKPYKING